MFLNWLLDHYRDYIVRKLGFELLSTIHVYFLIVVFARSIVEVIFFNRKSYRNFKTSLANAILASSNANRMPRQERGPEPNGIQAIGCLLFFNSGSNLDNNPRRLRWLCTSILVKRAHWKLPIGIEAERIRPQSGIVMYLPYGNLDICSSRNVILTQLGIFSRLASNKEYNGRVEPQGLAKHLIKVS